MKAMRIVLRVLLIILIFFSIFIGNGAVEKSIIERDIDTFKARGQFVVEYGRSSYYLVPKAYDYEDTTHQILDMDHRTFPGSTGDIYITNRNPLPQSLVVGWLSSIMWMGHCAIVSSEDGSRVFDIVGNQSYEDNIVRELENDWITRGALNEEIALIRIKNIDDDTRQSMMSYLQDHIGYRYNYTFLFNREHTFYCSDLASRTAAAAGVGINYDGLVTTGADMLISEHTYLIYYREKVIINNEEKYHIYYLGEPND